MTALHPRQRIALRHPCAGAEETLHPRFRAVEKDQGELLSTILTVNK